MNEPTFRAGDAVEYDSHYTQARRDGCITYPSGQPVVIRGTYLRRLGDIYSDVQVGGKPTLVRTDRLRSIAEPSPRPAA